MPSVRQTLSPLVQLAPSRCLTLLATVAGIKTAWHLLAPPSWRRTLAPIGLVWREDLLSAKEKLNSKVAADAVSITQPCCCLVSAEKYWMEPRLAAAMGKWSKSYTQPPPQPPPPPPQPLQQPPPAQPKPQPRQQPPTAKLPPPP